MKNIILATLLATVLTACGGSSAVTTPVITTPLVTTPVFDIETVQYKTLANIDLASASGYTGTDTIWYNILTVGDLNGDGYDDIVVGLFRHNATMDDPSGIKPVVLFYNPATATYAIDSNFQNNVPPAYHPRQAAILDVNGDSINDLYITNTGYDPAPYGWPNQLILGTSTSYTDGSYLLPKYNDYSHGLIVADLNGDGKKDLMVMNIGVNTSSVCIDIPVITGCQQGYNAYSKSYVLFQNATNTLTPSTVNFANPVDINLTQPSPQGEYAKLTVGASADFNKDGIPDLVYADQQYIYIAESTGWSNYKSAIKFSPPASFVNSCTNGIVPNIVPYSAIATTDIDGDEIPEIFASYTCNWYSGQAFQVLHKSSTTGAWTDITATVFPDQSANATPNNWCYKFIITDITGDGQPDLICQTLAGNLMGNNNTYWIQNKGVFTYKNLNLQSQKTAFNTVVNLKGTRMLLGFNQPSATFLKVMGWQLPN
jgi:hypothetical protein